MEEYNIDEILEEEYEDVTIEEPQEETPQEEVSQEETPVEDIPLEETPNEEQPQEEQPQEEQPQEENNNDLLEALRKLLSDNKEEDPMEEVPQEEQPQEEVLMEEQPQEDIPVRSAEPQNEIDYTTILNSIKSNQEDLYDYITEKDSNDNIYMTLDSISLSNCLLIIIIIILLFNIVVKFARGIL